MRCNEKELGLTSSRVQDVQHCIVAHQTQSGAMNIRRFLLPQEALHFLVKGTLLSELVFLWVDLQGCAAEQSRGLLQQLFPGMQSCQMEAVLVPDACDVVELQPALGQYVVGSLACSPARRGSFSASPATVSLGEEGEEDVVTCSFACSERCLVTVHAAPFVGLAEVLRHMEVGAGGHPQLGAPTESCELRGSAPTQVATTGPSVLCALTCLVSETYIPNLTGLISEVDSIDEIVMLVAPGKRDQTDLLRRILLLRRRIFSINAKLYMKERLLRKLIGPTMRTAFVSRESMTACAYKRMLAELQEVLERLEVAYDTLNHVNLNFASVVSMRMSQASAVFDSRIMFISQVVTICLPMNLLASIFGMNCKVPWGADEYDNLKAFWGIMGVMLLWAVFCVFLSSRRRIFGGEWFANPNN